MQETIGQEYARYVLMQQIERKYCRPVRLPISYKRNGGMRFVKIWRLCFSFCITREYRPFD